MKTIIQYILIIFVFGSLLSTNAAAQKTFTDHKPQYRTWQEDYILDKIEHTKERTIFYFRLRCQGSRFTHATFYPPGGKYPWYIGSRDSRKKYYLKEIKNVRRDGVLMKNRVHNKVYSVSTFNRPEPTIFSCEIHFERLPSSLTSVDLIEGIDRKYDKNHFNCFNIKLKQANDKELGSPKDSEKTIQEFEGKYNAEPKTKPKSELESH